MSHRTIWLVVPSAAAFAGFAGAISVGLPAILALACAYLIASVLAGLAVLLWADAHPPNDRVPTGIWLTGFTWPVMLAIHTYNLIRPGHRS